MVTSLIILIVDGHTVAVGVRTDSPTCYTSPFL